MSIKRQFHWLSEERVDLPYLRSLESSIAFDFDQAFGKAFAGREPLVLRGLTIPVTGTLSASPRTLQVNVASSLIFHYGASEAGTVFSIEDTASPQVLSATNANVLGDFSNGTVNYISLDLFRAADDTTADTAQFLDANTFLENGVVVPLARTLQYKIVISQSSFSASPNFLPIAKVTVSSVGLVTKIEDCRKMMFRLGSGGDVPNAQSSYGWGSRSENPTSYTSGALDPFVGADKSITSLKGWMDMVSTLIWETRGGSYWYSPTHRDNVKLAYGQPVITYNGDNFNFCYNSQAGATMTRTGGNLVTVTWNAHPFPNAPGATIDVYPGEANFPAGTKTITYIGANSFSYAETGANVSNAVIQKLSSLQWRSVSLLFENDTAYRSAITDNTLGTAFPDGSALYVDLDRTGGTITAAVKPMTTLGYSTIPGRRHILAWRYGTEVFTKDRAYEAGRSFIAATTSALGIVKLNATPESALAPQVVSIKTGGGAEVAATSGNTDALTLTGFGSGKGLYGLGGATNGTGVYGDGGGTNGVGVKGLGHGTGRGGEFQANGTAYGLYGIAAANTGIVGAAASGAYAGVAGIALGSGAGVTGTSATGHGVSGTGGGNGSGVVGTAGGAAGVGIWGIATGAGTAVLGLGDAGANSTGVKGTGGGNADGVWGTGGTTDGTGVYGKGGATNGNGLQGTGTGTGVGLRATPGAGTDVAIKADGFIKYNAALATTGAFTNTITQNNIAKVWVTITLNGTTNPAVSDSFNVTTAAVSAGSTTVYVPFQTNFANTNFCPTMSLYGFTTAIVQPQNLTTGHIYLHIYNTTTGATFDPTDAGLSGNKIHLVIYGTQ